MNVFFLFVMFAIPVCLMAQPAGGKAVFGSADISLEGKNTVIHQGSDKAILHWDDFSIGKGERLEFLMPHHSSSILNRVVLQNPSVIEGIIQANGNVYLLNPNGILIGSDGVINTAGFLASTLNLDDRLFLEGGVLQFSDAGPGSILNLGTIRCSSGDIVLFSKHVVNEGTLCTPNGGCYTGAAEEVFLQAAGDEKIWIKGIGKVENRGAMQAAAIEVKANAENPYSLAIQAGGLVSATGVVAEGGKIYLKADQGKVSIEGDLAAETGVIDIFGDRVCLDAGGRITADGAKEQNGGTIRLIGKELVCAEGSISSRGGELGGDGGFVELSAPTVEFLHEVDASAPCGKPGHLLLDPYDVQLSYADPGGVTSWVDVNPLSPVISTLDGGTSVTISTAVNTNYDVTRSNVEPGDIFVIDPVSVSGNGTLSLIADRNIEVSAKMSNTGLGSFSLSASGDISFASSGALEIGGVGVPVSCSATGSFLFNDPPVFGCTSTMITNNGDVTIQATNGDIHIFGSPSAMPGNTGTGTVHLETIGNGEIVFAAIMTCGKFEALAGPGGDVYIGNDSTGTLSLGVDTRIYDPSTTGYATSFEGENVTFQSGGGAESLLIAKGNFTAKARSGDILISCPGTRNVDIRSVAASTFTYDLSAANGSISMLGGANPTASVLIGTISVGSSGPMNVDTGVDLILTGGTGVGSLVDVRCTNGNWTIGRDFLATGGSGDSARIVCYSQAITPPTPLSSLDVGRNAIFTGGPGNSSSVQVVWDNVDFAIGSSMPPAPDGNLQVLGGAGMGTFSTAGVLFQQAGSSTQTVYRDVLVQGGTNTDCFADLAVSSSGNGDFVIGNDLSIMGGSGESAIGDLSVGSDLLDVGNNLLIQGSVGNAALNIDPVSGTQASVFVRGTSAQLLGGAGGTLAQSLGTARVNAQNADSFDMEVAGDLSMTGGAGMNADAGIISATTGVPGFQQIYVGGDITVSAGLSSGGISGILYLTAAAKSSVQRVEAGGNITATSGSGSSAATILGVALIDPSGILLPPGVDSPGPSIFVRSLGNIVGINGAGSYPAGIENIAIPFPSEYALPFPPPPGTAFIPGDIVVQAGGNVQLGSGMQTGTAIGSFNISNSIYVEANTQFAPGALWPGNVILGVSGPSLYPPGQGALIANTGSFPSVDFETVNGNISLFSAQNDITPALANYKGGTTADTFHIDTIGGNILINGFNDIHISDPLTTTGNGVLVVPATDQIFIQANRSIITSSPISLTGGGFSIGLYANLNMMSVGNIDLGQDVSANFTTGTINMDSPLGYIHQTIGTVTANTLNFNAASGIINTMLADQAVRTSAHFVNAINAAQLLYLYNTVAGANTVSTTAVLDNGTGAVNTGRHVYFAQHGGTSLIVNQATADGNASLLALDGQANLTFNGLSRAADNLIAVAYRNMTVAAGGTARAAQNVTLILDEYTGPAFGGSLFTNSGSVVSDLPIPNIAIYAASGLEPPAGYTVPNLMIPGGLSGIEVWDAAKPQGLIYKYATSWQAGGPYHGPGFGMAYVPGTGVFSSPVVWYKILPQLPSQPSKILGFESEIYQTNSLLNDFYKWGTEISFSILWKENELKKGWKQELSPKSYLFVDDPYRQHRVKETYERRTRRKYVYARSNRFGFSAPSNVLSDLLRESLSKEISAIPSGALDERALCSSGFPMNKPVVVGAPDCAAVDPDFTEELSSTFYLSKSCAPKGTVGKISRREVRFKAVVFIPKIEHMKKRQIETGIDVVSIPFLSSDPAFAEQIKDNYLFCPITEKSLKSLQNDVVSFYQSNGRDLVKVAIPEQEVSEGIVYVVVQEAKVGSVKVTGARYFSSKSIRKKIRVLEEGPLNIETLKEDISWINNSPFCKADVVLSPGERVGETDMEVIVQDRWPYRFYAGVDNTGTEITGKLRLFTGINLGNLFGCAQRLSYQFTSGMKYSDFHAHTGEYLAPLPWRHLIHIYGGYSEARPNMSNGDLHLEGKHWQADLRYQIPLNKNSNSVLQQISFGGDFKRINNNLEYGGDLVQSQYVNVIQAVLEYQNGYQNEQWRSSFDLRLSGSPGGIGKDNSTSQFQTLRPFAKSHYVVFDLEWSSAYLLQKEGWWLTGDLWGQVTNTNLLPSEQFILGGYNSIRGYEQSEVMVDNGIATSVELHTPNVSLLSSSRNKAARDALYFLAFLDYGWGRNHKLTTGEKGGISLLGVGAGLRYQIKTNLSARFDYAIPLIDPPYSPKRTQKVFFGGVISY